MTQTWQRKRTLWTQTCALHEHRHRINMDIYAGHGHEKKFKGPFQKTDIGYWWDGQIKIEKVIGGKDKA